MFSQHSSERLLQIEMKSGGFLQELQKIWDEVGVPDVERNMMLSKIEQECVEVFRMKVDEAEQCKAQMQKAIADCEAEFVDICAALGEKPPLFDRNGGGILKKELEIIIPKLEDMKKRKVEMGNQLLAILDQLQKLSKDLNRPLAENLYKMVVEERDLSLKRLEDLRSQLLEYQDEKKNRLKLIMDHLSVLNSLCSVLGMDFKHTIHRIHPTLDNEGAKDVSNSTIEGLSNSVQILREVKIQRWQRLQKFASALLEMWNLMDTPMEEQIKFQNVTSRTAASGSEITELNILSVDQLNHVEAEVLRLEKLKSSKLKEILLKKKLELEDICRRSHMVAEILGAAEYSNEAIESGVADPACLLEQMELQIERAKEEALGRKQILEKIEKWLAACQEESWLEEYNRDDNRYTAGRGAHLTLKRAEKARVIVNKIPGMVETLTSKATAWEKERGHEFLYDGTQLLSMLKEYIMLRQEKDQEKQRQRDQKRFQLQLQAAQEVLYGSKQSSSKSAKKPVDRKMSLGGALIRNQRVEKAAPNVHLIKKGDSLNQRTSYHSGVETPSLGKNGTEISGHSVKKQPSTAKASQMESPLIRKPLSPVFSEVSSKANIQNILEDQKRHQKKNIEAVHFFKEVPIMAPSLKALPHFIEVPILALTPSKPIFTNDEENRTPKTMSIQVPPTPSTLSAHMLTATSTPATPFTSGAHKVEKYERPVEYSFEEARAGFGQSISYNARN